MPDGEVVRFWALPGEMAPSEYVTVRLGWTATRKPPDSGPPYLPGAQLDAAWAFLFENG